MDAARRAFGSSITFETDEPSNGLNACAKTGDTVITLSADGPMAEFMGIKP